MNDHLGRACVLALSVVLVVFAVLRFAALQNDLWMDEIWSVRVVQELKSAGEIFTRYLQANNHPLSSIWLYAIAPASSDWMYRLLSWASGVVSLVLGASIAARQFRRSHPNSTTAQLRVAAFGAVVLLGSCYFLIVYASEARGYAPALAFSLLAYCILLRTHDAPNVARLLTYWLTCGGALLSHAAAVQVIGAALLWSIVHNARLRLPLAKNARIIAAWHLVPVAAMVVFYLYFLRRMSIGGAPDLNVQQSLGELVAYTFGFPSPTIGWMAMPFLIAAGAFGLWRMSRRSPADAVFYGLVIFAAPMSALIVAHLAALFPRYFIFGSAWALLLVAYGIAAVWHRHRIVPIASGGLVALFVIGNSLHTRELLRHGRGEYQAALSYIASHTPTPEISLCSDHDNRNLMLLQYYSPRAIPGRALRYFPGDRMHTARPQWLLVHRIDGAPIPQPQLADDRGNTYQLAQVFLHAPLAGWDWFVYRNTATGH